LAVRLSVALWILAAVVAAPLGAFVLGFAEDDEAKPMAWFLVGGAIGAIGIAIAVIRRPTRMSLSIAVVAAAAWLAISALGAPAYRFEQDRLVFVWLPAALTILAGLLALGAILAAPRRS
jgi:hypothetical protein